MNVVIQISWEFKRHAKMNKSIAETTGNSTLVHDRRDHLAVMLTLAAMLAVLSDQKELFKMKRHRLRKLPFVRRFHMSDV